MTAENIKSYIKERFRMNVVGIADAALLNDEPAGKRPADLLPGAKTVIVFGKKQIDGAVSTVVRKFEDGRRNAFGSYQAYGAGQASDLLMINANYEISRWLEKTWDVVAAPVPCGCVSIQNCVPEDPTLPLTAGGKKLELPFNISRAAELAGLGQMGWNGFFLTPEYGPRILMSAIITTAELECDAPYSGKRLCDPVSCGVCIAKCPAKAIPAADVPNAEINAKRCTVATCGFTKKYGRKDLVSSEEPSDDELRWAFENSSKDFPDHVRKSHCDVCAVFCPVGRQVSERK